MMTAWMPAADAARRLGITRPTLYAYVSRGYLRSQPAPGRTRDRLYAAEDVERLRQRTEQRRAPDKAAARVLQWGLPVLESAITLIDGRRLYYRGHDAMRLAERRSVDEVAALIWTGDIHRMPPPPAPLLRAGPSGRARAAVAGPRRAPFILRAQSLLAAAAAQDPAGFDVRAASVVRAGWRIVWLLATAAGARVRANVAIETALCRAWKAGPQGQAIVRSALILCADHELNVSAFTARCVASAGSHPYAVVIAGLAALEGPRHGGASARAEALLAALADERQLAAAVAGRLRRGEPFEGFGHPLYSDGDPRAAALLDLLARTRGSSREYLHAQQVAAAVTAATGEKPNLDFALAAVAHVLGLPPESPLTLFAIGRSIGWIGHALEQYAAGRLIRPRAKYVGVVPGLGKGTFGPEDGRE